VPELFVIVRSTLCLATAVALPLLAACSGGSHHDAMPAAQLATVRTATCHDWRTAPAAERSRLVEGMREFFGGQVDSPGRRGQVMPSPRATRLFDAYCSQPFASAFSLYRIYGNAAAFTLPDK
jgi:hypothetical protein